MFLKRRSSTASVKELENNYDYQALIAMARRRGFIFPGSEIYGGLAGSFDYGPLGAQFKKNIRDMWWRDFIQSRQDCVGLETSVIMNPKVWEASGHIDNFVDPLVECKCCNARIRFGCSTFICFII